MLLRHTLRQQHLLWISLRKMHLITVIHKLFQALIKRTADSVLATRNRAELRREHHAIEVHLVHPEHLQRPLQVVLEEHIVANRLAGLADQLHGPVHVSVVGELHREEGIGELTGLVGDRLDLPERHRMHKPLAVTQAQGADGQALHGAGVTRVEHHPIADGQGVFDNDEQASNHVLHQLLGTETDRQSHHPGARQQRRDIDAQVGHGGDRADHHQDDLHCIAQQRQDGFDPGTGLATGALIHRWFEGFLDRGVEHHPEQPGHQQDQADTAEGITDGPAHRVALGEFEQRNAPDTPEYLDKRDGHDDTQNRVQQTQEAFLVGAAALDRYLAAGLEQVLQHGAEKHRADQ